MPRAFEQLLVGAFRRRRLVLIGAALTALGAAACLLRVRFDSNVLHLLPQRSPAVQAFQTFLDAFGNLDRLYVMFVAPPDRVIGDDETAIDTYVAQLRGLPEIESVDSGRDDPGKDWSYLADRQLLLLGPTHVADALARLDPARYTAELMEARAQLGLPSADVKKLVQQDPLRLLPILRDRLAGGGMPLPFDPTQSGYVSDDHLSRLVIARPTRPPFDTTFARALNAKLDALAEAARTASAAADSSGARVPVEVREAGGYRAAAQAEAVIKRESIVSTVCSLVVIGLIVLAVFRSGRPLAAVFVPIVLAALVTVAAYGIWRSLSTAVAGSAAMLLGLGVDGTLLLYTIYVQRRLEGLEPVRAVAGLAPFAASVAIGFVTTAATFLGVVPVDQPALAELGRSVGLGVIVCGICAVLVVPALVSRTAPTPPAVGLRSPALARMIGRRRGVILATAALITVACAIAAARIQTVLTVDRLEPKIPAVAVEREIAARFHLAQDTLFVLGRGASLDPLLEAHERLLNELSRPADPAVSSPAMFLPSERTQRETMARVAAAGLTADRVRAALDDASRRVRFRAGSFGPFAGRLSAMLDANQRLTLDGYRSHGLDDLVSRFISSRNGVVTTVAYVTARSPEDIDRVERAVRSIGPPLQLTGLALVNRELQRRFRPDFLTGAAIGVIGVAVVLAIGFRTLRLVPLALAPTALGLLWSVGALSMAGVVLDLFSAFALLASIGIGVDYSVHVLYRRQTRPEAGIGGAVADVTPALVLAAATAIVGFGSLATSSYAPLRLFGIVSALTIVSCLVTAVVVLPAAIWDRR
jgi:predicted RND superfamily exporter protein